MPRLSATFLPTEREAPSDAEAISHKLMVRAGLIRQLGTGIWSWLPAGWRIHQRITGIIREEMDAIGAQEMLMPVLQPRELWHRTGRDEIDELFTLVDRKGAELVLAMTHEEAVTTHVAQVVRSYRDLPLALYHFQVKERDEPRPRAGVLRTREFVMKDSYTFDRDADALAHAYERHRGAYARIFDRCGLEWFECDADVGMMGGTGAHEYMAPCPAGENEVVIAPGYAANVEVASADAQPVELPTPLDGPETVATPGLTTVVEVSAALSLPTGALLKAFPVVAQDGRFVLALVRGDHSVNEIKLMNALGAPIRAAREDEIEERIGPVGYIGPVGVGVSVLLDRAVAPGPYVVGANRSGEHLRGVQPGRDFDFEHCDIRRVQAGDTWHGADLRIEPAIEVGNIFKLGTRYSDPLGATFLDESGKPASIQMGCYGIGPARIAAAAVEQTADEDGIAWPRAIAPWDIELVGLGKAGTDEHALAERLYAELADSGLSVLYDDRAMGPGQKFADADLLGCPLRLTVGRRTLEAGEVEVRGRRGRADLAAAPLEGIAGVVREHWSSRP